MREFNITIEQCRFHGFEFGDSSLPSLVCLHGMTGDSNSFLGLIDHLINDFHLILIDSPGHGGTAPLLTAEDYRFSSLSDKLFSVIHNLTDKPFYILGHSWGADLALHITKKFQHTIIGVILIDGGYVFPEHVGGMTEKTALEGWQDFIDSSRYESWDEVIQLYRTYTTKEWDRVLEETISSNFKKIENRYILKADRNSLLATIKAFFLEPCSTTFECIKCPVLLFHATVPTFDQSRTSGIERIQKSIENIKVVGVKNTKHNIHWDRPEKVASEILLWK
ncbi:alpha/beta fold hydrolase [Pseudalkalibacillus berkeleyi]|uniref:Alpha/beta hydrolase n=1 Tax=Pseudalkalibacillus berkeleyi TaxID=1069813 RepID=A0ABS9H3G0_9BACL|nr:alpha/beta hydrolase [Pseudalkalibacillus berkeleyi]MCF6138495.1 alpha/beta hydrolase [Pseudalkalibacillus berkeleyi]